MRYVLLLLGIAALCVGKIWYTAPWQQPWSALEAQKSPEYADVFAASAEVVQPARREELAQLPAGAGGRISGTLRIGFMNLCNYLDPQLSNKAKSAREREQIAAYIAEAKLQVLVVCELGDRKQLGELQQLLARHECHYAHVHVMKVPGELRNLAILSSIPFENHSREIVPIKTARGAELMRRGILHVRFAAGADSFDLLGVHFKSKFDGDQKTAATRLAEAQALLKYLRQLEQRALLVVGDFNDGPGSQVWDVLQAGLRGDLRALRPLDANGQAWTHHFTTQDSYSRIDAMWLNRAMLKRLGGAFTTGLAKQTQASDHRLLWLGR